MIETKNKILAMLLMASLLIGALPVAAFAAPASDIPESMLDNSILRALEYTGYDVQKQKDNNTIYQNGYYSIPLATNAPEILSDIHYGHKVDSVYNIYNATIVQDRLAEYLDQLREITTQNKPEMTFLILGGDLISGSIHSLIRIENMENTVQQVKNISELLSSFTYELSKFSNKVMVFSVPGNHSRIFPKKEENAKGEYLDTLVPFYMKAQMKDCANVTIMENQIDEEISCFRIYDHIFATTHGDKDTPNTVVPNMEKLLKVTPDVVIMGHRHSNGLLTHDRTKVIQNGCLCGMDNYTVTKRMVGNPEQIAFLVTADNPVKSLNNITFSAGRGVL